MLLTSVWFSFQNPNELDVRTIENDYVADIMNKVKRKVYPCMDAIS